MASGRVGADVRAPSAHQRRIVMMRRSGSVLVGVGVVAAVLGLTPLSLAQKEGAKPKAEEKSSAKAKDEGVTHDYSVEGQYVESCSCRIPCPCEMTGAMKGCTGVGAYQIDKGTYNGVDLSGARFAYATSVGEWVDIYVDAKDDAQAEAVKGMAGGFLKAFGKIEDVKNGKIDIKRDGYAFSVSVDGGKVMKFQTEPVIGGDKKTPLAHTNIGDPFNSTMYQGKGISTSYTSPKSDKSFTIDKGRNSYCNDKMKGSGQL
jgi:hypothetical protein